MVDLVQQIMNNLIYIILIITIINFFVYFIRYKCYDKDFFESLNDMWSYHAIATLILFFLIFLLSMLFDGSNKTILDFIINTFGVIVISLMFGFITGSIFFIIGLPGGFMGFLLADFMIESSKFNGKWNILKIYCKNVTTFTNSNNPNFEILPPNIQTKFIDMINDLENNDESINFLERLHTAPCFRMMDDVQIAALKKIKEFDLKHLL